MFTGKGAGGLLRFIFLERDLFVSLCIKDLARKVHLRKVITQQKIHNKNKVHNATEYC